MKKLTIIAAAVVGLALSAATSQAQIIVNPVVQAGGSTLGLSLYAAPVDPSYSATSVLPPPETLIGNYYSTVYVTGSGTLDFVYQINETGGNDAATGFSVGGYAGITVTAVYDIAGSGTAGYFLTGGQVSGSAGTLTIDAPTSAQDIVAGDSWDEVIVDTSATLASLNSASVFDSVSANTYAYAPATAAPVPEASTIMAGALMLLPLGIGAIRAIRKERTV